MVSRIPPVRAAAARNKTGRNCSLIAATGFIKSILSITAEIMVTEFDFLIKPMLIAHNAIPSTRHTSTKAFLNANIKSPSTRVSFTIWRTESVPIKIRKPPYSVKNIVVLMKSKITAAFAHTTDLRFMG